MEDSFIRELKGGKSCHLNRSFGLGRTRVSNTGDHSFPKIRVCMESELKRELTESTADSNNRVSVACGVEKLGSGTTHGIWWNLPGVFFEPVSTFQRINQNPTWILALSVAILARLARIFAFYNPSKVPQKLTLTVLIEVISVLMPVLICSGIFLLGLVLAGAMVSFVKVFSVLSHTFFAYFLIHVVLSSLVLLLASDRAAVDPQNPLVSNLGFLFNREDQLALNHFASSFDLIVFYHLFLIACGLESVSEPVSRRGVVWVVLGTWVLYIGTTTVIKAIVA